MDWIESFNFRQSCGTYVHIHIFKHVCGGEIVKFSLKIGKYIHLYVFCEQRSKKNWATSVIFKQWPKLKKTTQTAKIRPIWSPCS
jgi:hypothetical protein